MTIYDKTTKFDPYLSSLYNDPTACEAIKQIDNPNLGIDDISYNSKSLIHIGSSKLNKICNIKLTQLELIAEYKRLTGKTINRKSLSEWEDYGLLERGVKKGSFKYYSSVAPHELRASMLLSKSGNTKKCSLQEAGSVRRIYTEARDSCTLEETGIQPFIEPGEVVGPDNPKWKLKPFDFNEVLSEVRLRMWFRYMVLSRADFDPLSSAFIIHLQKITKAEGSPDYYACVTSDR